MEYADIYDESSQDIMSELRQNCTTIPPDYFDKFISTAHDRQVGVSVAFGIICVAGLLANAAVLFLLFTGGRKGATFKAPSTILILNLAVADILLLLTLPFAMSHRLHNKWKFGNTMCKFEEGVKFLSYYGSVFFITAMAVDRYFVVSRPRYINHKMARRRLCFTSAALWILAVIAVIPLLIFARVDEHGLCSIMFPRGPILVANPDLLLKAIREIGCIEDYLYLGEEDSYDSDISDVLFTNSNEASIPGSGSLKDYVNFIDNSMGLDYDDSGYAVCKHPDIRSLHIWLIWNFVIGFIVPFFFISLSYIRIMKVRVPAQQRHPGDSTLNNNQTEGDSKLMTHPGKHRKDIKLSKKKARMLMNVLVPCLIAAFVVCWFPYHFFHLLQIRGISIKSDAACHVIRDVTFCLAFFNSALNPILNSFFLYDFKQRLQKSKGWVAGRLKVLSSRGRQKNEQENGSGDDNETVLAEMTLITSPATREETAINT